MFIDLEILEEQWSRHVERLQYDPNFWAELDYLAQADPQPGAWQTPTGEDAYERWCFLSEVADWITRRQR